MRYDKIGKSKMIKLFLIKKTTRYEQDIHILFMFTHAEEDEYLLTE